MRKLNGSRVAIFGIGGVGGYATEALARSGVNAFELIDRDVVSESNLNRQIIATYKTIGRGKTEVMAERIHDINPDAQVTQRRCFYLPETADQFDFTQYDYIIDAVDTITAKIEIILRAQKAGVPVISSMGAGNKTDPSMFRVDDLSRTSVCPLAREMRRECRKRGIRDLKVVYSLQEMVRASKEESCAPAHEDGMGGSGTHPTDGFPCSSGRRKVPPGSTVFAPAAAGLLIASAVVEDLIRRREPADEAAMSDP
jgi:tRNA A37 threonylcarbamoyladenosine dehydratase